MSLKKYVNSIDMTKNPSEIYVSVMNVLKVSAFEDFAEIACHQEILLGQTTFDHVLRCVRETIAVEYFTRKRYFTSRVFFGVRTIHEVFVNCYRVSKTQQWLPDGQPVMCTSDNIKDVFKAKIEELNKLAMKDLSIAIGE